MKNFILKFTSILLLCIGLVFGSQLPILTPNVYAAPEDSEVEDDTPANEDENEGEDDNPTENEDNNESNPNVCTGEAGSISWILCPVLNTVSGFVDTIYNLIDQLLAIKPTTMDPESPIYQIWQKARDITNIVFIIFMLVVIYSQITGLGIDNYGIKRILPRLIIAVIMVNLSYLISAVLVDISNIIGAGIMDVFTKIQNSIVVPGDPFNDISWSQLFGHLSVGAATIWGISVAASGAGNIFWMLGIALIGALISVAIGLVTISLRQGVVLILIMIAPLAFVAYLLPNTEKWFTKWKNILGQMLIFYPMFSFLYGASKLAGWAIIHSTDDSLLIVLLGMAVQVFPLFMTASLLKMSNTILGSISSGLERLSNPARSTIGKWGDSHRDHSRKKYISRNGVSGYLTGSHLRNYLTYRQARRDFETQQLDAGNKGLIAARVGNHATTFKGYDKNGNAIYGHRPNFTTRTAKRAANNELLAKMSEAQMKNTMGEYNKIFKDRASQDLNAIGGQAFVGLQGQILRAENIATSDQSQLLDTYLKAIKSGEGSYSWNRLVKSNSISMGHVGEASLIGQVLMRSVEIEGRRKNEARVIGNKFNFPKLEYRAMILDVDKTDDSGREINRETGEYIEDDQFRHIAGKPEHLQWQQYIGVHKKTGEEITKEQYDALSKKDKEKYNRVRYCEILDDDGKTVQKVFFDDPGYMKEYLARDITVADPIVQRYSMSIGLDNDTGETGPLRKYHSTITSAILESRYKEHNGAMTAMFAAQANLGRVLNATHSNIGQLQSISASAQPGSMLMNDAYVFEGLAGMIQSVNDPELFNHYFKEDELESYKNVNGEKLKGLRLTANDDGHLYWKEVNSNDPTLTNEDRKNYIKHAVIPKTTSRLFSMLDKITPNVLDKQKEGTVKAIFEFVDTLQQAGLDNIDPNVAFEQKLNPDRNIFETPDAASIKQRAKALRRMSQEALDRKLAARAAEQATAGSTAADFSNIFQKHNRKMEENQRYREARESADDISEIISEIEKIFYSTVSYDELSENIRAKFENNETLTEYLDEVSEIIEQCRYENLNNNPNHYISGIHDEMEQRMDNLKEEMLSLLYNIEGSL